MTVKHYVLFQFQPQAPMDHITKAIQQLEQIPHVSNLAFGKTFTDRHKGYTHILSLDVPSKEDLEIYSAHPEHVAFVQTWIKPFVDSVLAMDIQV
jgi:hypothetical protein